MSKNQPPPMSLADLADELDDLITEVADQVRDDTPDAVLEAIAVQLRAAREARERIEREGSVVRDVKGSVIAHPAFGVEQSAIKLYTALMAKWA